MPIKRTPLTVLLIAGWIFLFGTQAGCVDIKSHYLVVHVDQNDPARMNLTLNNVFNVGKY